MGELFVEPWFWGDFVWRGMLAAVLVAIPSSLLGVVLYLRRRSMMVDAHSHLAVPGVVFAFLITGSLSAPVMLGGALIVAVVASGLVEVLAKRRSIKSDAAIGISFTPLFALGIIVLSTLVEDAHIDAHVLLFGNVLGISDRALVLLGIVAPSVALAVVLTWRWLAASTLDPDHAATLGIPVRAVHHGLMVAVAATTVASFEAVGAILVIALVIIPAATAHVVCERLSAMMLVACGVGIVSAVVGLYLSIWVSCSTAGAMVVCAGLIYATTLAFAPKHGLWRRAR